MQADVVPERRFLTSVGAQQKTHSLSVLKIREYVNERAVQRILYKSALSGCVRHQYIDVRKYKLYLHMYLQTPCVSSAIVAEATVIRHLFQS